MVRLFLGEAMASPKSEQESPIMAKKKQGKRYTAKFKFQVVMEVLAEEKTIAQIAKGYGVHPITLGHWKKEFMFWLKNRYAYLSVN